MTKTKITLPLFIISIFSLVSFSAGANSSALIPLPVSQTYSEGNFWLNPSTTIETGVTEVERELGEHLNEYIEGLFPMGSSASKSPNSINLEIVVRGNFREEGYRLTVNPNIITINAADRGGLFNGIQTLLQLMPPEVYSATPLSGSYAIPCQTIVDYPELSYRGNMMDIARTFRNKQAILKHIDGLSHHKINKLHWHLTDSESWRLEIKSYPELAAIGGFRGGNSPIPSVYGAWGEKYGGYITQKDAKEIVEYAKFRNIEIIPEIDLPGHSRAIALVYPEIKCDGPANNTPMGYDWRDVWCIGKEENFEMLEKIIDEICEIFPSKHIHIGGDEVPTRYWMQCSRCQKLVKEKGYSDYKYLTNYFIDRLSEMLRERGREAVVWNEVADDGKLDKRSVVTAWKDMDKARHTLGNGYKTIICAGSYFYLDMPQSLDEVGHSWGGVVDTKRLYSFGFKKEGITEEQIKNVVGIETTYFTESLLTQPYDFFEGQMFPRNCALAEVAWSNESKRNWDDFYERLTSHHLDRIGAMGIAYRQFPPVIDYSNGTIKANIPFEGAEIRYTSDGREPTLESTLYRGAIKSKEPQHFLFKTFYGGNGSPSVMPSVRASKSIAPGASVVVKIPLKGVVESGELWYYHITTSEREITMQNAKVVDNTGSKRTILGYPHDISRTYYKKLYTSESNDNGVLEVTVRNKNSYEADVTLILERSPYIEPRVKVTSSMPIRKTSKMSNIEDYDFATQAITSRTCKKGDHVTYTFERLVDAESIEILTGYRHVPLYVFQKGRVQISRDGNKFEDIESFQRVSTIYPDGPIKAVRIVSDQDGNVGHRVALQDLKIKPRRKK